MNGGGLMRKGWKIALAVLIVVVVLAAVGLLFAGNYLFRYALDPRNGDQEWTLEGDAAWFAENSQDRWLTSHDGLKLHGLYLPREDSHKYAVICHGYGSAPQFGGRFAAKFYEMGYHVLAPAARAHERSEGEYVSMGWLERRDIVAWVDTLVEQDPRAEIVLFGVSMGGATVMMTAGEADLSPNVKCVVEDCGYSSVWDEFAAQLKEQFGLPTFPVLNAASLVTQVRAGWNFKEASAVEQLKKAKLPMLFIHGEEDTFVPYAMLDVVHEACTSPEKEKLSVPGAGHGEASWEDPEGYWAAVERFLEKYIKTQE